MLTANGSVEARDLAAIGRRLPDLPATSAAMAAGKLDKPKLRTVLRVLTPENEGAWLDRAKDLTNRELENLVRDARRGEAPPPANDPVPLAPARVRVSLEMDACELDLVRRAILAIRQRAGVDEDELDDGACLAQIAQ